MSCDVGKATEGLENELRRRWSDWKVGEWAELIVIVIAELILQPFRHFTYVTTHSPTLPSLYLRHSSFFIPSVASTTSQLILQPSFASPTSLALHLRHLASRPCFLQYKIISEDVRGKFCHGSVFVPDSPVVRPPAREAEDSGSGPSSGQNFSLSIRKLDNRMDHFLRTKFSITPR